MFIENVAKHKKKYLVVNKKVDRYYKIIVKNNLMMCDYKYIFYSKLLLLL